MAKGTYHQADPPGFFDITCDEGDLVDLVVSSKGDRLWISVNGVSAVRICRMNKLILDDFRPKEERK